MNTESSKIIDELGGNAIVARMFRVSSQAVSKWRSQGIPDSRLMYIEVVRPDLFKKLDEERKAA